MGTQRTITDAVRAVYDKTHWFTDKEAWGLFRFFAFGEAVGWTMLITAITYRALGLPQAPSVIYVAGRLHGMFFIMYFIFVLLTARSMKWPGWKVGLGLIMGVAPYTSLVFEQMMAYMRRKHPVYVEPPINIE